MPASPSWSRIPTDTTVELEFEKRREEPIHRGSGDSGELVDGEGLAAFESFEQATRKSWETGSCR